MSRQGSSRPRGESRGRAVEIRVRRWEGLPSLKELFKAYYELDPPLVLPQDMARREFAFQPFDIESYVRHLSFGSEADLRAYLRSRPPRQAYHSVAIYQLPEAPSMEEKGWLGSEILLDIDLDHYDFCQGVMDDRCLERGFEEARKAAKIIRKATGGRALIYFTGHRGFHVRVKCDDCLQLGKDERRELARFVRAEGLDLSLIFPRAGPYRPSKPSPQDPGWRGLIAELYGDAIEGDDWLRSLRSARLGVDIDSMVTEDPSRLTRIPGTLNGKGALLVAPLCEGEAFKPGKWLSPFHGEAECRAVKSLDQTKILGYSVGFSEGEELSLPSGLALFLWLLGYVEIEGGTFVVRDNTGWWPVQGCDWTP